MSKPKLTALCQSAAFLLVLVLAAAIDGLAACGPAGWIAACAILLAALVLVSLPDWRPSRAKRKPPLVRTHKQGARWTSHHENTVIISNSAAFDKG